MADLGASRRKQRIKSRHQSNAAHDPAEGRAQCAVDAAEQNICFIKRADRCPIRQIPANVAPNQQTTKGDDERWNSLIANQPALPRTNDRARDKADCDGNPRDHRVAQLKAKHVWQP